MTRGKHLSLAFMNELDDIWISKDNLGVLKSYV